MRANRTSPSKKRTRQPQRNDYSQGITFVFDDGSKLFTRDPEMIKILKTPALLNNAIHQALERLGS